MKYRLPKYKFNQKWLIFGYGLCLYPYVFIKQKENDCDDWLLYHELWHSIEQQRDGLFKWLANHLKTMIFGNFTNEVEADDFGDYNKKEAQELGLTFKQQAEKIIETLNKY